MKALILQTFHRFVGTGEFTEVAKRGADGKPTGETERVERERKQQFPKGTTVTEGLDGVTAEDIDGWVGKGLAQAAD